MQLHSQLEAFLEQYPNRLVTVESHTVGEATRLVVGGIPSIPGKTINEKRFHLMHNWDHYRLMLTREPRGSRETVGVVVTEPVTPGASVGLIYMDAHRYPYMCGHGTIGAVTSLIETGILKAVEPETTLTIDTPSGPTRALARVIAGKVQSVSIQLVPCFVYSQDQVLEIPGFGRLRVDMVYAGGFFAMADAAQLGFALLPENARRIADLGMAVIEAANQQLTVRHPEQPEVTTVDVAEFYDLTEHSLCRGKGAVVYGESHVDRSPCGTGTSAKMALLHRKGELALNQTYTNAGILDTTFDARLVAETSVGDLPAVVPEITGSACITGINQFIVDSRDPFPQGFLLGS
jgi:proline racemase